MAPAKRGQDTEVGWHYSHENVRLGLDSEYSTNPEWQRHSDPDDKLISANAVSASTPHVVASALQRAGILDQK